MSAFDVLADPVRRRLLDLLRAGERSAGELVEAIQAEFELSQPTVSAHLRVLRDAGLAESRAVGNRRLYRVNAEPLQELEQWLAPYRALYLQRLDALGTELARGRRERSHTIAPPSHSSTSVRKSS